MSKLLINLSRYLTAKKMMGETILFQDGVQRKVNIMACLTNEDGLKRWIPGANLVTNDGDIYYAEEGAGESTTMTVAGLRLGSSNTTPTKNDTDVNTFLSGTNKVIDATYPMTSDTDGDNTGSGADIVSWRVSYTTGEANQNGIQEGAIVDNITTPTKALTHFLFAASFNKTNTDTLKVFVNHEMSGQA